jgi:hypothetical protein
LCVLFEIDHHGGRQGDTPQALAQLWHLVALSEAMEALHRAMCPVSCHCIRMAIDIASNLPAFLSSLKPRYCVVVIGVMSLFVLYGRPPMTMDAILVTIFDGGQVICRKLKLL